MTRKRLDAPSERVHQVWPAGLRERVQAAAGPRGVTAYTIRALERALDDRCPSCASPLIQGECWQCLA